MWRLSVGAVSVGEHSSDHKHQERQLSWTFSAHTVSIGTWVDLEAALYSAHHQAVGSQAGRSQQPLCPVKHKESFNRLKGLKP